MTRIAISIVCAVATIATATAQDKSLPVPGDVRGAFSETHSMPETIDKGAKGGPAEKFTFVLKTASKFRALLECDSCLPRLVLEKGDVGVVKKVDHFIAADLSAKLDAGAYTLWAGTLPGRQSPYVLTTSLGEDIAGKIQVFTSITASFQSGTKTVKRDVTVRVGLESVVLQDEESYGDAYKIFKTLKRSDIQSVEGSTTNKTNVGAAIMWGPSVAGAQQQKWVRITAAEQNIALEVPSKTYQLLLAELERIAKK